MPTLRVMTYNILYGGAGREQLIRDVVSAIGPDIAVFTEATDAKSFIAIADTVGPHRARGGGPRASEYPVVVSRWPIVHADRYGRPGARQKWIEARTHPFGGPPLDVHGVHLAAQPLWPFELWRRHEVRCLLTRLAHGAATSHVIAGDFNALMAGDEHRLDQSAAWVRAQWLLQGRMTPRWALGRLTGAGYVDCYRACNAKAQGFTVPAWDPQVRIDYVFASPSLRPALRASGTGESSKSPDATRSTPGRTLSELLGWKAVKSLGGEASDHLPVWADFEWPEGVSGFG